jgi:hypothetical protein
MHFVPCSANWPKFISGHVSMSAQIERSCFRRAKIFAALPKICAIVQKTKTISLPDKWHRPLYFTSISQFATAGIPILYIAARHFKARFFNGLIG